MAPTFSIITVCKGRLGHLRQSLPAMLAQADAEVIVVDYSCPDGAADYVEAEHALAQVVRISGKKYFSNWAGRNAGAAKAGADFLLLCDADVVLAKDATLRLRELVPSDAFGFFRNDASQRLGRDGLSANQLKGFQVVPRAAFERLGGYDERLTGYGAGGDTELEERLRFLLLKPIALPLALVDRVIPHGDEERMRFHSAKVGISFLTGYLYRWAKLAVMGVRKSADLKPALKNDIHAAAMKAARQYLRQQKPVSLNLDVVDEPISALRRGEGKSPRLKVSVRIEISSLEERALHDGALAAPELPR